MKLVQNSAGPLLGSFAGAAAALSSLWLKEYLDRKRLVQEWFEQEYVWGAINPLIELLQRWLYMLIHRDSLRSLRVEYSALPYLQITRLATLLRTGSLSRMFYVLSAAMYAITENFKDEERQLMDWQHTSGEIAFLRDLMLSLQSELLTIKVYKKADVATIHKRESIAALRARIDKHLETSKANNKMVKLRDEVSEWKQGITSIQDDLRELTGEGEITLEAATAMRDRCKGLEDELKHSGLLLSPIFGQTSELRGLFDQLVADVKSHQSASPGNDGTPE